jgi:superfamily II DNA or RNA helicase
MEVVTVKKINEVYLQVYCERSTSFELRDYFSFRLPGCEFTPSFKAGWDGYIRLFDINTGFIYAGLLDRIETFCEKRDYRLEYASDFSSVEFSVKEAQDFVSTLALPFTLRPYQLKAFVTGVRERRKLFLSPTASGKSLIIYLLTRYYSKKTLIICPTTNLVSQMASDFVEYGCDPALIHKIYDGSHTQVEHPIVISTWQGIYNKPKEYFDQYEVVIGDEAHGFTANSLTTIMHNLDRCVYRFGFTGTLEETVIDKLILHGLFGSIQVVEKTKNLIEQKYLSELDIKCIILSHSETARKAVYAEMKELEQKNLKRERYNKEIQFITTYAPRDKFIKNLALSLNNNTMVLFRYKKQGYALFAAIKKEAKDRNVYFVCDDVSTGDRERIRKIVDTEKNAIIVASIGTFSTGINIIHLRNIIFAHPSKGKIKILQSIGRVLRRSTTKTSATLFDICDDLSYKAWNNYGLHHFARRKHIYDSEKFIYRIYRVGITVEKKANQLY